MIYKVFVTTQRTFIFAAMLHPLSPAYGVCNPLIKLLAVEAIKNATSEASSNTASDNSASTELRENPTGTTTKKYTLYTRRGSTLTVYHTDGPALMQCQKTAQASFKEHFPLKYDSYTEIDAATESICTLHINQHKIRQVQQDRDSTIIWHEPQLNNLKTYSLFSNARMLAYGGTIQYQAKRDWEDSVAEFLLFSESEVSAPKTIIDSAYIKALDTNFLANPTIKMCAAFRNNSVHIETPRDIIITNTWEDLVKEVEAPKAVELSQENTAAAIQRAKDRLEERQLEERQLEERRAAEYLQSQRTSFISRAFDGIKNIR